ncbi:uncharacterized protein [Nicotiana tomentosiformis]|uniref:uncharacterized protein n=1 Tax=Nicotiana tomentosiformis TaxID=4098 RepID=UPI00388C7F19
MAGDNGKDATTTGVSGGGDETNKQKTISPYDITSNDNSGILITHMALKGENYDERTRFIRTALRARKKFEFIDGIMRRPDEKSPDFEDWWTINSLLVSWIRNAIKPTLYLPIPHMEVVEDLWTSIKERFSISNGPRIE